MSKSNPVFGKQLLDYLFMPGKDKTSRMSNRYAKGYLKRSIFSRGLWVTNNKPHQGKQECERRVRQMASGMLKP